MHLPYLDINDKLNINLFINGDSIDEFNIQLTKLSEWKQVPPKIDQK